MSKHSFWTYQPAYKKMPSIKISKSKLKRLLGKRVSDKSLKERISYLGTDLEYMMGDEIAVEIFPNRPDMLSEYGLARALSSFMGITTGLRKYKVVKPSHELLIHKSVKKVRPNTACAIVRNLDLDNDKIKEIIRIQEKLHITYGRHRRKCAIGIYPFEKIQPPITYMALPPEKIAFQPLEMQKKLSAREILSTHPAGKEYGHLLEGQELYPLFIDSKDQILSMPPIINSDTVGRVTEKTKDVFIECSGFDYEVLRKCLNMIVCSLADMGGEIEAMNILFAQEMITSPDLSEEKIKIDIEYINSKLGLDLSKGQVKNLLGRMGYGYKHHNALIPPYRTDVLHQIDLVEDIAIAYGYENFEAQPLSSPTIASEDKFHVFKQRVSQLMIGLGLLEVRPYNLANSEEQTRMMLIDQELIKLKNPTTETHDVLRSWLIPSLMSVLSHNKHHEYPQEVYTIGSVFGRSENVPTGILEQERIAVALCRTDANFTKAKQVLDYLFSSIGVKYAMREVQHGSFIAGRVGRASAGKKDLAYIGEIHPKVLENFGIEYPVAAFELNLTELFKQL